MFDLKKQFKGKRGQIRVAEFLLSNGLSINQKKQVFSKDAEISHAAIARVVGVDRRIVGQTIAEIQKSEELKNIYENLESILLLRNIAKPLGFGAIEIIPNDASRPGIVSDVSSVIDNANIAIRQITTDDPMFSGAKMTVVTEKPIPRKLIDTLLALESVKEVVVLC
ncbi:MAG: amino acid-binding protein [Candidatus Altiarchaeota archaeon]